DQVFQATNDRDAALRQIFQIFPTFLDESKATLTRLQTFSNNTKPLVTDLRPVARKLNPTVKDLADLSPDLKALFRELNPLITVSDKNPPCHEQGVSAWDGNLFPRLDRGKAPNQKAPDDPGVSEAGQPKHYK